MKNIILTSNNKTGRKRPGRGISAGQGKTSGRGTKGQNARAGHNIPKRFEGGQTPLSMRLPKLPGFKHKKTEYTILTLDTISSNFSNGETVSIEGLIKKNLIKKGEKVKVLNNGKLTKKVSIKDIMISKSALALFEAEKEGLVKKPIKKKTINKNSTLNKEGN